MSNIVLGTVDQGGDGLVILLAAVSAAKGKDFQMEDFVFTNPQANTNPTFQRNSFIKMQPLAASGYYGVNTIYYNRINGSELETIILQPTDVVGKTLISELLDTINDQLGVYIKPSDIIDAPIPEPGVDGAITIELLFSESSVIFYSGAEIIIPPEHVCPPCPEPEGGGWVPEIIFVDVPPTGQYVAKTVNPTDIGRSSLATRLFSSDLTDNTSKSIALHSNYTADDTGYLQMEQRMLLSNNGLEVVFTNRAEKNRVMAAWGDFNTEEETDPVALQGVYYMDEFGNVLLNGQRINNHFGTSTNSAPVNRYEGMSADDIPLAEHYFTDVESIDPTVMETYTPHWRVLCVKNGGGGYIHALVVPNYDDTCYKAPPVARVTVKLCGQVIPLERYTHNGYDHRQYAFYVYSVDNGLTWRTGWELDEEENYYNEDELDNLVVQLDGIYKYQMGSNQMYASGNRVCFPVLINHPEESSGPQYNTGIYRNYRQNLDSNNKTAQLRFIEISKTDPDILSTDNAEIYCDLDKVGQGGQSLSRGILGVYLCDRSAVADFTTLSDQYTSGFIAPTTPLETAIADDINGFILLNEMGTITMHHFNTKFSNQPGLDSYINPTPENPPELVDMTIRPCKNGYDPYVFIQYGSVENVDADCLKAMSSLQPMTFDLLLQDLPGDDQILHYKAHVFMTPARLSTNPNDHLWTTDTAVVVQESRYDAQNPDTTRALDGFQPAFATPTGLMIPNGAYLASEDFSSLTITAGNTKSILVKGIKHSRGDTYGVYGVSLSKVIDETALRVGLTTIIATESETGTVSSDSVGNYAVGKIAAKLKHSVVIDTSMSLITGDVDEPMFNNVTRSQASNGYKKFRFDGTNAQLYNKNPANNQTLYGSLIDFDYIKYALWGSDSGLPQPPMTEPKGLYPFPIDLDPIENYDLRVQPFLEGVGHTVNTGHSTRWYDNSTRSTPVFFIKNSNHFTSFCTSMLADYADIYNSYGPDGAALVYSVGLLPATVVTAKETAVSFSRVRQSMTSEFLVTHNYGDTPSNYRVMLTNGAVIPDGQFFKKNYYGRMNQYVQISGMLNNHGLSPSTAIDGAIRLDDVDTIYNTDLSAQLFSKGLSNKGARLETKIMRNYTYKAGAHKPEDSGYMQDVVDVLVYPKYGSGLTNQRNSMFYYGQGAQGAAYEKLATPQPAVGYAGSEGHLISSTGYLNNASEIIELVETSPVHAERGAMIEYTLLSRYYYPTVYQENNGLTPAEPTRTQVLVIANKDPIYSDDGHFDFTAQDATERTLPSAVGGAYNRIFTYSFFYDSAKTTQYLTVVTNGYVFQLIQCFWYNQEAFTQGKIIGQETPVYGLGVTQPFEIPSIIYAPELGGSHTVGRLIPVRIDSKHSFPYVITSQPDPLDPEAPLIPITGYVDGNSILYDTVANCFVIIKLILEPDNEPPVHLYVEKVATGFTKPVIPGESDIYFNLTWIDTAPE